MSATPTNTPLKVLGIDPGSRFLGFGVVTKLGNKLTHVESGVVKVNLAHETHRRLISIYEGVRQLLAEHQPHHVAVEKMFFAKDAVAAMKLGQARGVTLLAVGQAAMPLFEYSPNEVKMAVAGHGHADKDQIARMVSLILGVREFERADVSDALAIAICHLNTYSYRVRMEGAHP